ncbi:MAG: hypothetical protein LBR73_08850 [Oscillospiraceae bacterium]|jgi:Na+-translocating ferredoxin:NAD+ oxidoreductase RnfE subunit|nr:hypothetical protein [Oscillospiraceae bacterium]
MPDERNREDLGTATENPKTAPTVTSSFPKLTPSDTMEFRALKNLDALPSRSMEAPTDTAAFPKLAGDQHIFRRMVWKENAVFYHAAGLAALIAGATTARAAVVIAGITTLELIVCEALTTAFLKKLPAWLRCFFYVLISTAIVTPIFSFLEGQDDAAVATLGVFLPLLAVSSVVAIRCERCAVWSKSVKNSMRDALGSAVGYAMVCIFFGIVREVLGRGQLFDRALSADASTHVRALLFPFGGFLLLGGLAAAWKLINFISLPAEETEPVVEPVRPLKMAAPDELKTVGAVRQNVNMTTGEISIEAIKAEIARREATGQTRPGAVTKGATGGITQPPRYPHFPQYETQSKMNKETLRSALDSLYAEMGDDFREAFSPESEADNAAADTADGKESEE